jgi:hypothetical protein
MYKAIGIIIAILYASAGCQIVKNGTRFRVLDASDSQPVVGVRAKGIPNFPIGLFCLDRTPAYATSDSTGLVQFNNGVDNEVTFEKEGYETCEIVADSPGYRLRNRWLFNRQTFPWEDEQTAIILLQPRRRE